MISLAEDKKMLGYGSLGSYSNISHFVTTRRGGCSKQSDSDRINQGIHQRVMCARSEKRGIKLSGKARPVAQYFCFGK